MTRRMVYTEWGRPSYRKTLQRDGEIVERGDGCALVKLNGIYLLVEVEGDEFMSVEGKVNEAFEHYRL